VTDTYFSAAAMNRAIDMAQKGLRDLHSKDLVPFYRQPVPIPDSYPADAYEKVLATMEPADLATPSQPTFSTELTDSAGAQLFIDFMRDSGIFLSEEEADVSALDRSSDLPDLGPLTDFLNSLQEQGLATPDMARVRALAAILDIPTPPATSLHIKIVPPSSHGEPDPIVGRRLARMRDYVRAYFIG